MAHQDDAAGCANAATHLVGWPTTGVGSADVIDSMGRTQLAPPPDWAVGDDSDDETRTEMALEIAELADRRNKP